MKPPMVKTPSLPCVSSIAGLASSPISMNSSTPQLMSAWVRSGRFFLFICNPSPCLFSLVYPLCSCLLLCPHHPGLPLRQNPTWKLFTTNAFYITPTRYRYPPLLCMIWIREVGEALKLIAWPNVEEQRPPIDDEDWNWWKRCIFWSFRQVLLHHFLCHVFTFEFVFRVRY